MKKSAGILIIIALSFWGCASFGNYYFRQANQAEINKNWDEAIKFYEKAILENPREYSYKLALTRARLSASLEHIGEARRLATQGKKEEALKEYEKALNYDPQNRAIPEEMRRLAPETSPREKPKPFKLEYPVQLKVGKDKIELKFKDASLRSIFEALGKHAGVNLIYDELFKDMPVTIDISGKEFADAVGYLCLASKNFYRVIDERTVIIVPDQPVKRIQYEQNAIQVFYLSNINAQDIFAALQQMLRSQFRAPNIFVDKNLNTITVRDTPANIELAASLIQKWDKSKAEVVIDLEIMEVSRQKLLNIGVDLDNVYLGLRYSGPGASSDTGWYNLSELDLGKKTSYQISLPTAVIRFLESDADTKMLAQPRLRGLADEEIKTMVGQKIPIPQTTFSPIAAGGVNQQPITSFTYQDVGLDIKVKPKIHMEGEVTLEIEVKITAIAGSGYADIPIIATREIKNVIRLRDGESNLLAGLLRDEERKSLSGVAGLKNIPVLGNLFGATDKTIDQSDLILTITPYIIRQIPRTAEDDKPVWIELEGISTSGRGRGEEEPGFGRQDILDRVIQPPGLPQASDESDRNQGDNQVSLDPANFEVPRGREFRISVNVRTQQELGNMSVSLSFNSQVAKLKDVIEGGLVRQMGDKVPFLKSIADGSCTIGLSSPQVGRGFRGGGNLAVLIFDAAGQGETAISVANVSANSVTGQAVNFSGREARVAVR
jgi:general secretion pathway protein D